MFSVADVTDLVHTAQALQHGATHDTVTGLPNRVLLLDRLDQALRRPGRTFVAVIHLDLDRFRLLNTSLGAASADRVLAGVGARLQETVADGDSVARTGDDSFVVLSVAARAESRRRDAGQPAAGGSARADGGRRPGDRARRQPRRGRRRVGLRTGRRSVERRRHRHHRGQGSGRRAPGAGPPAAAVGVGAATGDRAGAAAGPGAGRAVAGVPARGVAGDGPGGGRRGPPAVGPPDARRAGTGRLHRGGRGDRAHRADRVVGAARGVPGGGLVATADAGRRGPVRGGQHLGPAAGGGRPGRRCRPRPALGRAAAEPAVRGGHRGHGRTGLGRGPQHAAPVAADGRARRPRRLRHRLLVVQLPAAVAGGHREARRLVRGPVGQRRAGPHRSWSRW